MPMTLLSSLNRSRNVAWKEAVEKKGLRVITSCWKDEDHAVRCRVQASFHALSVALEWATTASSATAASTGCTRNAVGSST